jgi:hypothetical protein
MRLSVPTNWDPALLAGLAGFPVGELYGSLAQAPVGSGRPKVALPQVDQGQRPARTSPPRTPRAWPSITCSTPQSA